MNADGESSGNPLSRLFFNRSALSIWMQRRALEYVIGGIGVPRSVTVEQTKIDRLSANWVIPPGSMGQRIIFYLQGGGFALGTSRSHLPFLSRLCMATGCNGLIINYRLAPTHPFPAALNDVTRTMRWLCEHHLDPGNIVICGDGSGAGLAVSAMTCLRDEGIKLPAGALLISPWVDLVNSERTLRFQDQGYNQKLEGIRMSYYADLYAGELDPNNPLISPLYGNLEGLPPVLIQAGRQAVLAEDAQRLSDRFKSQGVDVHLEYYEGSRHSLPLFAGRVPQADRLLEHGARFLTSQLGYMGEHQR